MKKKVNVGFRATPERQKQLLQLSLDRGQSVQQMLEQGLDLLLADDRPPPTDEERAKLEELQWAAGLNKQERRLVHALLEVLHSRNRDAIGAVTETLLSFRRLITPPSDNPQKSVTNLTEKPLLLNEESILPEGRIDEVLQFVLRILTSGHAVAIRALLSNIMAFLELSESGGGNGETKQISDLSFDPRSPGDLARKAEDAREIARRPAAGRKRAG